MATDGAVVDAAASGALEEVRTLIEARANINEDKGGCTPLYAASLNGHLPVVEALVEAGAHKDAPTEGGFTPLFTAAQNGHLPVVEALVEAGAHKDAPNKNGATPLYVAAQNGHLPVVEALVKAGADVAAKTKTGHTALDVAKGEAVATLLREAPAIRAAAVKAAPAKAAAAKAAAAKAAAEQAAAAKAATEKAAAEKAATEKAAADKAAAAMAAAEKALLEEGMLPWLCAFGFFLWDASDLGTILIRNGVRVPVSALAQTDEHLCRLLHEAGLPDGLAVQVPLLLHALRSVRASRSAVAAAINPGQDVGDWLRDDVGLDDASSKETAAVFKADGVEMDTMGLILAQEEGEIEELVVSLPAGVRMPLLEALHDARAGRLKPRPDPASTRAVLEAAWCVSEEVATWLTTLPTMNPKAVSAVGVACLARGIRTKGSLLAQSDPTLVALVSQLPKGPQKPLQDAMRSARKEGLGWRLSGTPRDASTFEPPATPTMFAAERGGVKALEQAQGRIMDIARAGKEAEKGQVFKQATKLVDEVETSCFCFSSTSATIVSDSGNTRCVRCGEDKSRHVGPSESCFDPTDFACTTCGGQESAHAKSSAGKMYCSNWFGLEAAFTCTHCSKLAAAHHGGSKFCKPEEQHACALCGKASKDHHGAVRTCTSESEGVVAAWLFAVDHFRDASALHTNGSNVISRDAGSRDGSPAPPQRLPGQADEEDDEEEEEGLSEVHKLLAGAAAELIGRFGSDHPSVEAPHDKFQAETKSLVFGKPAEAALGVAFFMKVDPQDLNAKLSRGLDALRAEFEEFGTEEDKECLRYVLEEEAGSSAICFQAGMRRDCDPTGNVLPERCVPDASAPGGMRGMRFQDFCRHQHSEIARLSGHHVAALRLYTTAAYKSINSPL